MRIFISLLFFVFVMIPVDIVYGQSPKTVKQKAHDNQIKRAAFKNTDQDKFLVNIYTVDEKSMVGRTHYWFLALRSADEKILNYAKIKLKGHLKSDPSVKFSYINPVFSLCDEGKYVIGFVRVNQSGPWVLEAEISSKGIADTITYEIEVAEKI